MSLSFLSQVRAVHKLALVVAGASLLGCATATAPAVSTPSFTITVAGEGTASGQPDIASVRLGIEARGASAEEAVQSANRTMADILEAVKAQGVASRDVQTADFSVYFERHEDQPLPESPMPLEKEALSEPQAAKPEAASKPSHPVAPIARRGVFVVRNTALVNVRDLSKLGEVLGAAMRAGANDVQNLQLQIDDPTTLRSQARQQAVKNAHTKAVELAKASNVKLGAVVEISESGSTQPPYPMASKRMEMAQQDSSVPTERGELTVREHVTVVFKIVD